MKKKNIFIMLFVMAYVLFIIVLGISIHNSFNPKKIGEVYASLYDPLDYSVDIIEANMNEITVSNDNWNWAKLKEINHGDEQLENTYDLLVSDIRTCYLLSNDLENKVYNNMKILSLKDKTSITEKEMSALRKNRSCL